VAKWNKSSRIRGALRQIFRMSPQRKAVLMDARVEFVEYNKDGSQAKRNAVWYECAECDELFKPTDIEVDHVQGLPPSPGSKYAAPTQTWDELIQKLFYSEMQCLCKGCHRTKTYGSKDA